MTGRQACIVAVALVTLATPTLMAATPAAASSTQCQVTGRDLTCGYVVETPAAPPAPAPAPTDATQTRPPADAGTPTAVWTSEPMNRREAFGDANFVGMESCTTSDGQPGTRYRNTLLSPTGDVLETSVTCVGEQEPADATPAAAPPAPAPPPPPTREELVTASPIPQPVIQRNPAVRGLTGMASWFWASSSTTVEASVTVRGWTVTGVLGAGSLTWDTGDGSQYTTSIPGTADQPAVEHTYEQDGTWQVTVDMAWSGSYTISGYGTSYTVDGLTATGTSTVDYEVIEARAVLDIPVG